jgi:site-specific recombinase XerD
MARALAVIPKTAIAPGRSGITLPALFCPDDTTATRVLEFFTANIRNPNTRKAYASALRNFGLWCGQHRLSGLRAITPIHVATYIEHLQAGLSAPTVKIHLAALRMMFDWLVLGQIIPTNPASVVRGPKHVVKKGKTTVLAADEARALLDAIDTSTITGLRDRALVALLVYTFARVGAAIKMRGEDVYTQGRRTWVRLHEKGGKRHEMPCHHNLDAYLDAYIERAGDKENPKQYLFRTAIARTGTLSARPMSQADVYRMIRRRAGAAGIGTKIGCHTFRATGITEYLRNGGKLEIAQQMANHESARTTGLYDRRDDQLSLDEVERILI